MVTPLSVSYPHGPAYWFVQTNNVYHRAMYETKSYLCCVNVNKDTPYNAKDV